MGEKFEFEKKKCVCHFRKSYCIIERFCYFLLCIKKKQLKHLVKSLNLLFNISSSLIIKTQKENLRQNKKSSDFFFVKFNNKIKGISFYFKSLIEIALKIKQL